MKNSKYIHFYEINLWNNVDNSDPTLENSLFGAVKLVKNADIVQVFWICIGFDMKENFGFPALNLVGM